MWPGDVKESGFFLWSLYKCVSRGSIVMYDMDANVKNDESALTYNISFRSNRHETRITNLLGIQYPIVLSSMAWITDAVLASAVSEAGGLEQSVRIPDPGQ